MDRPSWRLVIVFDFLLTSHDVAVESAHIAADRAVKQYGFVNVHLEGGRSYPALVISDVSEDRLPDLSRFITCAFEDYLLHRVELTRNRIEIEQAIAVQREEEQAAHERRLRLLKGKRSA